MPINFTISWSKGYRRRRRRAFSYPKRYAVLRYYMKRSCKKLKASAWLYVDGKGDGRAKVILGIILTRENTYKLYVAYIVDESR